MRLAQTDAGMDVERIEHNRLAAPALRDLFCRRMGERIAASDHEGIEGEAGIERRAAERIVHCGNRPGYGDAQIAAVKPDLAPVALERYLVRLVFGCRPARHDRGAHGKLDAATARVLCLPAGEHLLGIVRLDP